MPVRRAADTAPDTHIRTGEVAAILQVSKETVTRWARAGKLPHMRTLGGHRVYSEAEIRALLQELTSPVAEEVPDAR
jgi:excisionase family DNA binding protein